MRIIEVNKYSDFLTLEEIWQNTLQRSNYHTVFSTWEWLTTWWKHFGKDKRLVLLLAKENDKILGIAPLVYSVHKMFGLRMGKIEFIGTPHSDYNDFIMTENSEECLKLFIEHLHNLPEKWDCIELTDIPEKAECLPFLKKISENFKVVHKCPYFELPKSLEALLKGLSRNQRKNIRRNERRLEEAFKLEFIDFSEVQSYSEGMNYLFELHQKRWRSKGLAGAFADERFRKFHLDIARSFSHKGWLGLFVLKLSGKPAAVAYGFKYRSKYFDYLTGFDPKFSKYSIVEVLRAHMINRFIQEGLVAFDFLRGAEAYKDRWRTTSRSNFQAVLIRRDRFAKVRHRMYSEYWHQGNRLKYLLKLK